MQGKNNITDEALTRYLSGLSSEEESEAVESYLSENEEREGALLGIADSIRIQRQAEQAKRIPVWKSVRIAVAAVLLAVLVSGAFALSQRQMNPVEVNPAASYASQDSAETLDTMQISLSHE